MAPRTKLKSDSSLGGMRKPAISGRVEVGSGAHISRNEARTGRIATVRRSGVMYAIAPVHAWARAVHTPCTHALHTRRGTCSGGTAELCRRARCPTAQPHRDAVAAGEAPADEEGQRHADREHANKHWEGPPAKEAADGNRPHLCTHPAAEC